MSEDAITMIKRVGVEGKFDHKFDGRPGEKTKRSLVRLYFSFVRRLDVIISQSDEKFRVDNQYILNQLLINRYIRSGAACLAWSNSLGLLYDDNEDGTSIVFDDPNICLGAVSDHLQFYYKEVVKLDIKSNIIRGDFETDHRHRSDIIEDSQWAHYITSHTALSERLTLLEKAFQKMLDAKSREGYVDFVLKYVVGPVLVLVNIGITLRSMWTSHIWVDAIKDNNWFLSHRKTKIIFLLLTTWTFRSRGGASEVAPPMTPNNLPNQCQGRAGLTLTSHCLCQQAAQVRVEHLRSIKI
jgi:hypothetical protein